MIAPSIPRVFKHLILDTFRQACASGICWVMLAVTALCALVCASVAINGDISLEGGDEPALFLPRTSAAVMLPGVTAALSSDSPLNAAAMLGVAGKKWFALEASPERAQREGIDTVSGQMTVGFGIVSVPIGRERKDAVHFLELVFGVGIAGTVGLLMTLLWTAGFVPAFVEPGAASILLAKPVPRWQLLAGKYLGVLTFVAFQVALFVGLTWLALGVRTGIWELTYWWCVPLLLLQFAVFYSFSVLLGVLTRSTIVCVFGSAIFWLLAWGVNYGRIALSAANGYLPKFTQTLADAAYWVSPKPIDSGLILFNTLGADGHFEKPYFFTALEAAGSFSPSLSILSSFTIAVVLLAIAVHEFEATDY